MTLFQRMYNWIKNLSLPAWLKPLVQELNDILITILKAAGRAYISYLQQLVLEAAGKPLTPQEKFKYVYEKATKKALSMGIELKDSEIRALIEFFVAKFKNIGIA